MEDELLSLGDFIDKAIVKCLKEYDRKKESLADSEGISPLAVASHSVSSSAFPQPLAHHKLTDGQKVCHSKGKESLQAPTMSARKYQNMGRSTVTEPEWHHVQSVLDGADLVVVGCSGVSTVQASSAVDKEQDLHEHVIGCELDSSELGQLDSETLQPKLLRFLENGEFRRVGGINTLTSNVRVIAATNRNLLEYAEEKKFRRDLLFRLNVITLTIPPLAERGKDIILLAEYFLDKKSSIHAKKKLSPEAKSELMNYEFPGNVRELEHMIERAIIFSEGEIIELKDLNLPKFRSAPEYMGEDADQFLKLEDIERLHIRKALNLNEWNREQTARALGISQKTLYSKIKKYSLK